MSNRYINHYLLPEIGKNGQKILKKSHILIIGAGGLGCSVLQTLVGAGIGKITLIDNDIIELSNLHRQPLYKKNDIGQKKVKIAIKNMKKYNEEVEIIPIVSYFTPKNAEKLIKNSTIVLDCADSFGVTYIASDICKKINKPFVSASALKFNGYVGGFCYNTPSYRAIFSTIPKNILKCNSIGVIGSIVAVLGQIQAQLTLNFLLKINPCSMGQLIIVNMQTLSFNKINFKNAPEYKGIIFKFIDLSQINLTDINLDLRTKNELPKLKSINFSRINIDQLDKSLNQLDILHFKNKQINLICKTGLRSWRVAKILNAKGYKKISLIAMN